MQTYLVGGAVRDMLLGIEHRERDWVVVGSTPGAMLDQGFTQVGKEFPVFLHPQSKEEYALARTEKKRGAGHTGFEVFADPSVTLEQDLCRRDLTINAIAQKADGTLVDPYHGLRDIKQKVLRHVSEAFAEDPLRVLRVARFKARLHHLGFTIAPETLQLLRDMSAGGELDTLAPERIWQELAKALAEPSPQQFVQVMYQCGALASIMPELDASFHRIDNLTSNTEKTGQRILKALEYAARQNFDTEIRFAILLHALDGTGPPKNLDLKRVNSTAGASTLIDKLCEKLRAPNKFTDIAKLASKYTQFALRAHSAKPDGIMDLFDNCDAWRRPERFEQFLLSCEALTAATADQPGDSTAALAFLRSSFKACQAINAKEFVDAGISGEAVGESIRNARKTVLASFRKQFSG